MIEFFKDKKVFLTGNTGFKGSYMSFMLANAGAKVRGYALKPSENSLFNILKIDEKTDCVYGDIRDRENLLQACLDFEPDVVIHMAAQPLVIDSYNDPAYTYDVNVMGTVNILECVRKCDSVKAFLNVTTDKVYKNKEWHWGYRENEELCGYDPYSNSKSCSELVTYSYKMSFFGEGKKNTAIATARAGNVIGGGDFADNRIIPDCVRAAEKGEVITVRNKTSIRPWQHVFEPVYTYLDIAKKLYEEGEKFQGSYNIGPEDSDCVSVAVLAELFCKYWPEAKWEYVPVKNAVHEATFLKLDISKSKRELGYRPVWNVEDAVKESVLWSRALISGEDMEKYTKEQIKRFIGAKEE